MIPSGAALLSVPAAEERPSLVYPDSPHALGGRLGLGVSVDVLPRSLVESEMRQVPRLWFAGRWAAPFGGFVSARVQGNVLANELSAAIGFARTFGPLSVALHERVAFWLGWVGVSGFDTTAWGLMTMPGATIGVRSGTFRLSARFELLMVHAQHVQLPDATFERKRFVFAGEALSLVVEDRVGANGLLQYGVTATLAYPDYQLWLAFSDLDRKRVYPTLFAGYAF